MKYSYALVAALTAAGAAAAPVEKRGFLDGKMSTTWWGQSSHELSEVCDSGNFDVVYLSFVTSLDPPALNLGKDTFGASDAQKKAGFDGLTDGTKPSDNGPSVADQIKGCQAKGKKIMMSFGGDSGMSDAVWKSSDAAKQGADHYWDLFLGGDGAQDARPFGKDVTLDGIDLDNETHQGQYYKDFVSELRSKMNGDKSKKYYISAAPEARDLTTTDDNKCSIPNSVYPMLDWVNVQFYNDEVNGIGGANFQSSVKGWADKISKAGSGKLLVGMPGSQKAATGAKLSIKSGPDMANTISDVKKMNLPAYGGISVWDAGYTMDNGDWMKSVHAAL